MYCFKPEIYEELSSEIRRSLADNCYFSGWAEVADGDVVCRLVASLIIYRRRVAPLSDERDTIVNVVPVWWECRTSADGAEVENDFDFEEFRCAMIEE